MTLTAPRPVSSTARRTAGSAAAGAGAPPLHADPAQQRLLRHRRRPGGRREHDGAAVRRHRAAQGPLGFVVVTYLLFLALYTLLVSFDENGPAVRDRVAAVVVHSIAAVLFGALVAVVVYTVYRGRSALPYLSFFTEDLSNTGPLDPSTWAAWPTPCSARSS
jgi:hypothetical protein